MYNNKDIFGALERRLNAEKMTLVRELLHESRREEYFVTMDNNAFSIMEQQGILDAFNEVCNNLGINWGHTNEPIY